MDIHAKQMELRDIFDETRFQFVSSELDLAITFCQAAISSTQTARYERNARNANKAYRAARHFLHEKELTKTQRRDIQDKVERLNDLQRKLREQPRRRQRASR
jgi:hypothetical protein